MDTKEQIYILNKVEAKYSNNLFPNLVDIIRDYIYANPDELDKFTNTNMTVDYILKKLAFSKMIGQDYQVISNKFLIDLIEIILGGGSLCG